MSKRLTRYISTVLILIGSTVMTGCSKSDNSTASTDVEASVAAAQPVANAAGITTEEASTQIPTPGPNSTPSSVVIASSPGEQIPTDTSRLSPAALVEQQTGTTTRPAREVSVPQLARVQGSVQSARSVLQIEPSVLNLGQFATNETKAATVTLTNISDSAVTIERAKTSCGCTTTGLDPGTVIAPGESVEVNISLRGGSRAQVLNKTVSFIVAGMDPIQLPVRGQTIEFVKITPSNLDQMSNPEGKIVLRAIDNEAFKITGMSPPLMGEDELPQESKVEHVITFPWDRLEDFGFTRRITFHLDHPKAEQVFFTIKRDPGEVIPNAQRQAAVPLKLSPPTRTGMALIALMFRKSQTDDIIAKLDDGLNIESKDTTGLTVLGLACRYSKGDFVQTLIERGADIEAQDGAGRTPLMTASQHGNLNAVQALIDSGAQINGRDRIGNTPISWAAGFGNVACVSELIESGADIEAVSTVTGWTPLIWAAGFGEASSVEVIIAAGANLEVADIMQGATPLINAARTGKPESLSALINAGAKLEAKDRNGKTAFLSACENSGGTPEKVKLLIAAGADVFAKDTRGRTAYQLASARTDSYGAEVAGILKPYFENRTPE